MSETLGERLAAIKVRAERSQLTASILSGGMSEQYADDVPWLIAYIEQLQALLAVATDRVTYGDVGAVLDLEPHDVLALERSEAETGERLIRSLKDREALGCSEVQSEG